VLKADADFSTTVSDVATSWEENPDLTLRWTTQADFKAKAALYDTTLGERIETGSKRPSVTSDLKDTDDKLEEGIEYIKRYLASKFGNKASVHYAKFGIVKVGNGYVLPKDRDKRKKAIELILPALAAEGFNNEAFGQAYFTPLISNFNNQAGTAKTTDKNVSGLVSDKNTLKIQITKVLKALIKIIEGNFPDTYKAELRKWGFQKEKY